jgi:pimeloyl-ACP methyl ester carboxylesterase
VEHFRTRGADARLSSAADGEGTVAENAKKLSEEIQNLADTLGTDENGDQRKIVLIGHSKGGVDACAVLSLYEHRLKDLVLGVVTVQTPYGGSPVASDLVATDALKTVTGKALEILLRAPEPNAGGRLVQPLLDVTYEARMRFLEHHPLPSRFPVVSFSTVTNAPSSLVSLSASYLRNRYDGLASDGVVAREDAEVPGCVAVRWDAEQDHADGAYPRAMSDARYERYLTGMDCGFAGSDLAEASPEGSTEQGFSREGARGDEKGVFEPLPSETSQNENEMVPSFEARALALRNRDAQKRDDARRRSSGTRFSGDFDIAKFAEEFKRIFNGDFDSDEKRSDWIDPTRPPIHLKGEASASPDDEDASDVSQTSSAPTPGAGTLLVRAYLALNAAAPDRLGASATQGEFYEALASLLLERANEMDAENEW